MKKLLGLLIGVLIGVLVMLVFGLMGQPIVEQDEVLSMAVEVINNG
jgi:purine-cytosine permease-like protein